MKFVTEYFGTVIPTVTHADIITGRQYFNGIVATSTIPALTIPALKRRYKCEYCDTITEEPGNCKNCGAPVVEVKE